MRNSVSANYAIKLFDVNELFNQFADKYIYERFARKKIDELSFDI